MQETREISALFHLIDDPDVEVFKTVADKIIDYGLEIIPNLEHLWETTPDEDTQIRIELLIHRLHFRDIKEAFENWSKMADPDLFTGAMLVARFQYPDLDINALREEVQKLRRNIWLEINSYLTPLEETNVLSTILYGYFNLKGFETSYQQPNDFLINKVIESKKGNPIGNGILYLIFCDMLDIPIRAINIPKQFILAYFEKEFDFDEMNDKLSEKIQFYIDPATGQVYTQKDIDVYFKRISVPPVASYFTPLSNKMVIKHLLLEFSKCFKDERNDYKQAELMELAGMLDEN